MGDPVVQQLSAVLASHGQAALAEPARLEQWLNQAGGAQPGKIKAIIVLLEKKAVAYLSNWGNDQRPERLTFEQVRDGLARKFADAKLLDAATAAWAVEAWAAALHVRPLAAGAPAAAAPGELAVAPLAAAIAAAPPAAAASPMAGGGRNAYAPPTAAVDDPRAEGGDLGTLLPDGRGVGVGRGLSWIGGGWRLFKESPGIWVVNILILLGLSIVSNLLGGVGSIIMFLLSPILVAGLMIGCRAQEEGESLEVGHLFEGFKTHPGSLILVGLVYLLVVMGVFMIVGTVFGLGAMGVLATRSLGTMMTGTLVAMAAMVLFMMPLMMAYYYAATLVALNDLGVMEAVKGGFLAGFKNILPLLAYGIVTLILFVLAAIPLLLGWLVMFPVAVASMYSSYRDVFYQE
jgi:uncharacterized membrane protein